MCMVCVELVHVALFSEVKKIMYHVIYFYKTSMDLVYVSIIYFTCNIKNHFICFIFIDMHYNMYI